MMTKEKIVIETNRTFLKKINKNDFIEIKAILQDIDVMYAWEHAFSNDEVKWWIDENIRRYEEDGYSYFAVVLKSSKNIIGVCGLINEYADGEKNVGIGYIFNKNYWKMGYAFESASAIVDYGFEKLGLEQITAQIRPQNERSIKLANKLKMCEKKRFVKVYKEKEMIHILYVLNKNERKFAEKI